MPLVHINLVKGRPIDKIEDMISSVSTAISDSLDAPVESVRVIVHELEKHQYGVGGKPWTIVEQERAAAAATNGDAEA